MSAGHDEAIARIAQEHHGIFAIHHLDELRVSRQIRFGRVANGRWERMYDTVYRLAGAPVTWQGDLLAACWAGGTRAVASHRSAAALWNLPSGCTELVEVTTPRWRRARHDGLIVHESTRIDDVDRASVGNVPCTSPARTLFDLARTLTPMMLDANIDSAIRRRLVERADLIEAATRLATKGRPGGRRFRAAVDERTSGPTPESVPERKLARYLVLQGLPTPTLQFEVRTGAGELIARADLAYPAAKILIEYDSVQEHTGKLALIRDSARRNAVTELGFAVLTATVGDLADRGSRLATSIRRLQARAA
jgi:very-short-patch-repair endonuclease